MYDNNLMEELVLKVIRKQVNLGGPTMISLEEAQAIVQMIYITYNKVNQLCADMYRSEHEKNTDAVKHYNY